MYSNLFMWGGVFAGAPAGVGEIGNGITHAEELWGPVQIPYMQGDMKADEGVCVEGKG